MSCPAIKVNAFDERDIGVKQNHQLKSNLEGMAQYFLERDIGILFQSSHLVHIKVGISISLSWILLFER